MIKTMKALCYIALVTLAFWGFIRMNAMRPDYLWDGISLLFLGAGWLYIFVNFSLLEVLQAFAQGLGTLSGAQPLALSEQILAQLGKYGLLAGGVSMLLGIFQALSDLGDIDALGAALALSLIPVIWALGVYTVVLQPLQSAVTRQRILDEEL